MSKSRNHFASQNTNRQIQKESYKTIDREAVARTAYEIYEQRGRQDGFDQQDWLKAEARVRRALTEKEQKNSSKY